MIEIIATTLEDVKRIEASGADRIELVSALSEGGLTPSYALAKRAVQSANISIFDSELTLEGNGNCKNNYWWLGVKYIAGCHKKIYNIFGIMLLY